MSENAFGDMDPEIAALLGSTGTNNNSVPDFNNLFGDSEPEEQNQTQETDLAVAGYPTITKRLEEQPHEFFNDPNYYKAALSNEGDISQRVHSILQKYLTAKDPKDRSVFRQQFIAPFWEFLLNVARKATEKMPPPKKFLLRFAILHPTLIKPDTRTLFSKIIVEDEHNQPVYYLDEWLKGIGTGKINPSTTDEVQVKRNPHSKLTGALEKATGKLEGAKDMLKNKDRARKEIESIIRDRFESVFEHIPLREMPEVSDCLSETQRFAINEIQSLFKDLMKNDYETASYIREFTSSESEVNYLKERIEAEGGAAEADIGAIDAEFNTVRQMAKMTIGRQGNHFPILLGEYFHCTPNDIGTRENVISMLAKIESIDAEAFCRVYKNRTNRIAPYVLLIPTYGDTGFCWEPFDRRNRATSRGRIIIPMYPKNLYLAVLTAVADLRWQVAKEKASFYWMEEGLTGNYYQWFLSEKLKGDIKEYFIRDYIFWMTKESEGIQKLDKDVRGTFWRHMPFTREVKEKLKNRNLVYQELYQRDINRSLSDGY